MSAQFAALDEQPDIIIATPGRLMHHLIEVKFSLKQVQYCVFDEADRYDQQSTRPAMRCSMPCAQRFASPACTLTHCAHSLLLLLLLCAPCCWRRCRVLFCRSLPLFSLFEMGFAAQLHEIIKQLGDERQTSLFSATMPKGMQNHQQRERRERRAASDRPTNADDRLAWRRHAILCPPLAHSHSQSCTRAHSHETTARCDP